MAELYEYEVTDDHGNPTTMQLTEEDAKRFPGAKKGGAVEETEPPGHTDDDDGDDKRGVKNRARR